MFKVEINENLVRWYLNNQMFKPDGSFCDKARGILNMAEQNKKEIQYLSDIPEILKSLKIRKQEMESEINSEKSRQIINKSQNFFQAQIPKNVIVKIFLLFHKGEGAGGTFCRGEEPLIFLRVSSDKKFPISIIWHEYMHYLAELSAYFKIKRSELAQNMQIPKSMKMGAKSIIEEGIIYVAEPLISERKINQSDVNVEKLGEYRAWGAFRQQTLNNRKYLNLNDVFDSILEDWTSFTKKYKIDDL